MASVCTLVTRAFSTFQNGRRSFGTVVTRMDTLKCGTLKFVYIKYQAILVKSHQRFTKFNYGVTKQFMKANHFEPALRPNHLRSEPDPAVILCLNRVSFICLYLFMCHEVSHHILEYPSSKNPFGTWSQPRFQALLLERGCDRETKDREWVLPALVKLSIFVCYEARHSVQSNYSLLLHG